MSDEHKVFYKFFYDIFEEPRLVRFDCSNPRTPIGTSTISWDVDKATDLIGYCFTPRVIWESEINLVTSLHEALSLLTEKIDERITWAEGQIELARNAKDKVALSDLWNKEE